MLESLLKKHWGFGSFRPLQREIILSVLQGNDTLALLPTGGGKSICYQLPALAKEGVCFVFSPLIALMKDQVDNLTKRNITAVALHSGLTNNELETELQNTLNGKYKLVYLSPERAATKQFRSYLKNIPVSFFVVDEAHCISQWGHQFRPEYLQLGELKEIVPDSNFIAVSATATDHVQSDILKFLNFKNDEHIFKKSFKRENLSYLVFKESNKVQRIVKILSKLHGTALVYANTRRKCEEVAKLLEASGISGAYYHGGLASNLRAQVQEDWLSNKTRVVVCTNAFGMGIDKPDVRLVVHYEAPKSPEAYYQEAGRAGRDGLAAYCILLANNAEVKDSWNSYPSLPQLEHILNCLYNYHQMAFTSGKGMTYPLNIQEFIERFKLKYHEVNNALGVLHALGYVKLNEALFNLPKVKFIVGQEELYKYQVANAVQDMFIKLLLRSHGGMFEHYVGLRYDELAKRQKCSQADLKKQLIKLSEDGIIDYIPGQSGNSVTYLKARPTKIEFDKKVYVTLRDREDYRQEYINLYTNNNSDCRENMLLKYFGEDRKEDCGKCDICRLLKKTSFKKNELNDVIALIKEQTVNNSLTFEAILGLFNSLEEKKIATTIKWLLDNEHLIKTNQTYTWNKNQA